jgi:cell division protein FtsI/penicillin-binding protein 2
LTSLRRALWLTLTAIAISLLLSACGGSSVSAQTALMRYLAAWDRGDWAAMRAQVLNPPAAFTAVNSQAFGALGISDASFVPLRLTIARSGDSASARVSEHFTLPHVGAWSPVTTVRLVKRAGTWKVAWSPATVNPSLKMGEKLAVREIWPPRAPILGADGAELTTKAHNVVVGVVGGRIKKASAVRADLLTAGATRAEVSQALAQAAAHRTEFEPVFTVSQPRFEQLKSRPGPQNVYSVPGTEFERTTATAAITSQLAAHVVGTLGPITSQELKALGAPYDDTSVVGQSGLQASKERTLAGAPSTHIDVEDAGGDPVKLLASFAGHPGSAVRTTIDPRVQRAAEKALAQSKRPDVSMVAVRASTGQVLAVVADPLSTYDTALEGAYPPGSTFKVLTFTGLHAHGLTPSSPTSCPSTLTVDGERFNNAAGVGPASTIGTAFTESCNTAFISLATAHLSAGDYPAAARLFGLDRTPQLGLPAFSANVPAPKSHTELAADAIGQGRLTFSPLGMAQVAAAIDGGVVRAPRLVKGAPDDSRPPSRLPTDLVSDLRAMMAQVTTSGTAAGTGLPAGTHAKTGTAEYGVGSKSELKIDGWLMGYYGDIAFAIVTQNTGGADGGPIDGPLIANFLDALGPTGRSG